MNLLPIYDEIKEFSNFSHSILQCADRPKLAKEIQLMAREKGKVVPADFTSYLSVDENYEEPHYGSTLKDRYGDPIYYVDVLELLQFSDHKYVKDNYKNKAVWAYLEELPEGTKIALFFY